MIRKKNCSTKNNLLPNCLKENVLRELTQYTPLQSLKLSTTTQTIIKNKQKTQIVHHNFLEPKKKENTRQKSQEISKNQILQKQRKKRKLEGKKFYHKKIGKIATTTIIETSKSIKKTLQNLHSTS